MNTLTGSTPPVDSPRDLPAGLVTIAEALALLALRWGPFSPLD
jgi:hypothetical protein